MNPRGLLKGFSLDDEIFKVVFYILKNIYIFFFAILWHLRCFEDYLNILKYILQKFCGIYVGKVGLAKAYIAKISMVFPWSLHSFSDKM